MYKEERDFVIHKNKQVQQQRAVTQLSERNRQHPELTRFDKTRAKSPDPQKKQHSTGNYREERSRETINTLIISTSSGHYMF